MSKIGFAFSCFCFSTLNLIETLRSCSFVFLQRSKKTSFCAPMAESDRSRSPVPGRNRAEPRAPVPPVRHELPFFPRWCGPMQTAVWHSQQMSRPQSRPQFRPQFNLQQSGAHLLNQSTSQNSSILSGTWPNPRFPPALHLHLPWHIHFHLVRQLHLVHLPCLVHLPKPPHPALHQSLRPNLVKLLLHTRTHQEVIQLSMTAAHTALISILTGKRIKTTTTIRRSTA